MFAPNFLSEEDRKRLTEINQMISGGVGFDATGVVSDSDLNRLIEERDAIMSRMKPINACSYDELQHLRKELFEKHQKCARIRSPQIRAIAGYIRQVEFRISLLARQSVTEAERVKSTDATRGSKVRSKQHSYSWTIKSESGGGDTD